MEILVQPALAPPTDNPTESPDEVVPPQPQPPENTDTEDDDLATISIPHAFVNEQTTTDSSSTPERAKVFELTVEEPEATAESIASSGSNTPDAGQDHFSTYSRLYSPALANIEQPSFSSAIAGNAADSILLDRLANSLEEFQQDVEEQQWEKKLIAGSATSVFIGVTAATTIWLASGSAILSLVASSLPAWASFDPVYVLSNRRIAPEDKSLSEILEASRKAKSGH